jgi:hypothetical protein
MAAMDMRRARAIAEQKIKSGQNRGLGLEDLVQQIIAESAGAPDTAIGNALVVVPQRLTPATPAPMQTGIPMFAPKPTTEMLPQPQEQELPVAEAPQRAAPRRSQFRPMLEAYEGRIAALQDEMRKAAENKQPPDVINQARLRSLQDQAGQFRLFAEAEEGAAVPEEVQAALANRQERLARREELLAEAKARSPWEALLAGGAALAQGRRGERDTEALARGLQAGLQQYGSARRANEEGIEQLGEARDQVVMDRYNALEKARTDARAMVNAGMDVSEKTLRIAGLNDKQIENAALLPSNIEKGKADAKKATIEAESAQAIINSEIEKNYASAAYARGQGRQADSDKVDVEKRMAGQALQALADDYDAAAAVYNASLRENGMMASMVPAEVKSAFLAAQAKLKSRSSSYARTYGSSPFIQNERPRATSKTTAAPSGVINLGEIGKPGR